MGGCSNLKYPILYAKDATDFFSLGLGVLTNTLEAKVTEERNGSFFLEAKVLTDTEMYKKIELDSLIKTDAGASLKEQRFRVKRVIENHDGTADIYAEHISYLTQELSLQPRVLLKGNGTGALNQWANAIIDNHPFVTSSTVRTESQTSLEIGDVDNAREALGGVQGSILDKWGGEYLFDNYHIALKEKRGKTANTLIAYGRNITDFEQEKNIMSTYTSLFPYARYTDDDQNEHLVTLPEYLVDSEYVKNYPNRKALPVDFSSEFEGKNKPTPAKLRTLAKSYIKDNEIGIPKVSIQVSFLDLSKTLDYKEMATLEELNLCDDVRVEYPKLGVSTVSKVVKIVWDVLADRYETIEIGAKRTTLGTTIKEQNDTIKEIEKNSNNAQLSADGKNMIFYGLYGEDGLGEPTATKVGDLWYKPNGDYTIMYVWNGTVWEQVLNTEDEAIIKDELVQMDKDVQEAKDKADEVAVSLGDVVGKLDDIEYDVDGLASEVTINSNEISGLVTKTDGHSTQLANLTIEADRISSQVVDLQNEEIGTDNLLLNSDFVDDLNKWEWIKDGKMLPEVTDLLSTETKIVPSGKVLLIPTKGRDGLGGKIYQNVNTDFVKQSEKFTFSLYYADRANDYSVFKAYLLAKYNGSKSDKEFGSKKDIRSQQDFNRYVETVEVDTVNLKELHFVIETQSAYSITIGKLLIQAPMLVVGSKTGDWGQGNETTYSQITQLSDDILLRVQKNDVVNQINISTEGILIDGKKVHITGRTTIDNAVIKNAMIDSMTASKLTAGAIDANKIDVINLNANNIATGTLNGIYINLDKTMTIAENGQIVSSYNYGDDYGNAYNPRWFDGTSRYGNRYLNFLSNTYDVNSNNTRGKFRHYTETFVGPDMFKLRQYPSVSNSKTPISHLDITADQLLSGSGWGTDISISFKKGEIYASSYVSTTRVESSNGEFTQGLFVRSEDGLRVGRINALSNYDTLIINNKRLDLGDLALSKDSSGRRIQSYAVYSRTYGGGATVTVTDAGTLGRITSAAKYKLDIEDADSVMEKAFKVLEINPKMWFDKMEVESIAEAMTNGELKKLEADRQIRRHHGFVADEFHEKGLDEVVIYDSKGEIEGLSYDRISMYHNVILKRQQDEIETLKRQVAELIGGD